MEPCCARKLVEDAVEYASKLGIPPHPDYKKGCRVFGGISVADCDQEFEFGNDGKPFFMQGPYDSPKKVARIMSLLTDRCGEGNFHYLLAVPEF